MRSGGFELWENGMRRFCSGVFFYFGAGLCIATLLMGNLNLGETGNTLVQWIATKGPNCGWLCHPPTGHGAVSFSFQPFEGQIMLKAQHSKSNCNAIGIDQLNDA